MSVLASMRRVVTALVMSCFAGVPALAQVRAEVTPHLGMYLPFGTLVEEHHPDGDVALRKRQLGGLLVGARFRFGGPTSALEATIGYSPGLVAVTNAASTTDVPAGVVLASVRGHFRIRHPVPRGEWRFHVGPGIGIVERHGEAWTGTEGTTDPALILAGGGSMSLDHAAATLRLEFEDYISWAEFNRGTPVHLTTSRVHHDLVWSFGVVIAVGGG